jgi:ATP-dependent RNA helicase MRH4
LVNQVGSLFKAFAHTVKFRASMVSAADSGVVIRNRVFSPGGLDVIISTPHLLSSIANGDPNVLSRVSHLVLDEADSLLDRSFAPISSTIIDRAAPSLKKLILCSATIPKSLDSYMQKRFPDIRRLATPNLHAIPRRVQLGVVDVEKDPYRGNKDLACADAIWTIGRGAERDEDESGNKSMKRIIVFVNEREKTHELADFLVAKGIDAIALNRDATGTRGSEALTAFTTHPQDTAKGQEGSQAKETKGMPAKSGKRALPNTKVIVMTDLGSRGIDTLAVRHVILYDVPHTTVDFIHRLGRTGRMGRRGRGIVLVGRRDRKDVVREVQEGMYMGKALI